ncbi:hypothetical protein, conserved [Eimeria necatrix]|uniref:DUF803 domain-containing protein n=1 Tax=Eimeria necatrix TaxID=51315 RepID=U6MNJ8_9EIME|nr:hypothetical protein, conserved [Eimeria necatrix]CDJ65581.1 hypothetical protein, conserved [Eimeria necatrix]
MTTHLQGRSSWGPETISRCFSSISSFGHSNANDNSSSSSRGSSKPEPEAIELHEWKTSTSRRPSVCSSETSTKQRQNEADKSSAPRANASPASSQGGVVRWLGHKGSTFWGSLFLLLLLSVCSPLATEATAPTSEEPILDQYVSSQNWGHTRDPFDGREAPPRRLNTVAAWAAEVESSLRLSPQLSLYLGVFLTLSGSLLMAGGSTLMKLGLSVEDADALSGQSCDQQWVWGFAAYVLGACMHVVALGFAPASVLSPMNSIGLIANAVASATVLKEPFGFQELLFTGGCAFGVFLCACASVLPRTEFVDLGSDLDSRYVGLYSWHDPWYLAFLGLCCGLGFGALVYLNSVESALLEEKEQQLLRQTDRDIALLPPRGPSEQDYAQKDAGPSTMLSPRSQTKQSLYPRLVGLCYGFLAGLVGSQCILEVKEIGTCVRYGLTQSSIWFSPQPYLVCCFLGLSVWMQIHFLNLGLARGDATTIVPTYYVVWTFFGTLGGFAKFHEVQGFSASALILFGLGFGLTAMCIILLAVEEMRNLRKYVDQQVPGIDDEEADLAAQDLVEQRLSKRVTFAMGMFPISSLGRTAGRRRFRPVYQRFRRTRSTASDTALGDAYGELTLGSTSVAGAYTLPPNLHFPRRSADQGYSQQNRGSGERQDPQGIPLRTLNATSSGSSVKGPDPLNRVSWGSSGSPKQSSLTSEKQSAEPYAMSKAPAHYLMPPSLRSSLQSDCSSSGLTDQKDLYLVWSPLSAMQHQKATQYQ